MNRAEILEFINSNPMCQLATVDGDQPRVRGMMMYKADADGIVFHTGRFKDMFRQLTENNRVEICFHNPENSKQVRVCGKAEFLADMELKQQIVAARPFMKPWIEKHGYDNLIVFRVSHCKAAVWSMETISEPTTFTELL